MKTTQKDAYIKAYQKTVEDTKRSVNDSSTNFNGGYSKNGYKYSPSKDQMDFYDKLSQVIANYTPSGNYKDSKGRIWYSEKQMPYQTRDEGKSGIKYGKWVAHK